MACEQFQEFIHAYIDGELELLGNVPIAIHLGYCKACRSEHSEQLKLRSLVRNKARQFVAPASLRKKIEKQTTFTLARQ